MPSSQARKERRALDRAASAVALGLGGEMGPLERAKAEHRPRDPQWMRQPNGRTRMRDYICPAKQYRTHPDAQVRAIAEAQADEYHRLNDYIVHGEVHEGKCWAKACRKDVPWSISLDAQSASQAMGTQKSAAI